MVNFTAKFQREQGARAPSESGRKNSQFLANKSPYLRNGARYDHSHNDRLIGIRKSHTHFRLVQKPSTLDDLERPKRTLLQKRCAFWSPLHKIAWRYTHTISDKNLSEWFSFQEGVWGYSRWFLLAGASNESGVVDDGNFWRFYSSYRTSSESSEIPKK